MGSWYANSLPTWMKQNPGPQPFHSVLQGQQMQSFNPGGYFGPGGETLPSYQRYQHLAPSEQQGYTGYLQDTLGVNPQDVYGLMDKLKPTTSFGSAAPRWSY